MARIDAVVTYLFEMIFRDMLDETSDEIKNGDSFHHQSAILMPVVVKSDHVTIIFINAGSGDNRPAKVAPDVFGHNLRATLVGSGMDIETIFVVPIDGSFHLFEVRAELDLEFIEEGGLKSIA